MTRWWRSLIFLFLLPLCLPLYAIQLGEWTHYYAYNDLTHIVPTNNAVYALSAGRLFSYNPKDESLTEYNTTNILNDHNYISDICWNSSTQCLVIVYDNGNIDMLSTKDNSVVNNASIVNDMSVNRKDIQNIICHDKYAYIVMPYGVITLNTQKREFGDTYRFVNTEGIFHNAWVENDSLFLINSANMSQFSQASIIRGCLRDNLLDKSQWHPVNWMRAREVQSSALQYVQGRNIGNKQAWADNPWFVPATGAVILPERPEKTKNCNIIADRYNNCYWSSDEEGGLVKFAKTGDNTYEQQWQKGMKPYGPGNNNFCNIAWHSNRLYTVGLGWRTKADSNKPGDIQVYIPATADWHMFSTPTNEELGFSFVATSSISVDPRDTSHVMVGAKSGLYEFRGGRFIKRWHSGNSPIKAIPGDASGQYQMVLGVTYDANGSLWVLNSASPNGLLRFDQASANGVVTKEEWTTHNLPDIDTQSPYSRFLTSPVFDAKGNLWFVNTNYEGVSFYCYSPTTGDLRKYTPSYNQDGTSLYDNSGDGFLRNINIDSEGNVWLCGTKGVCYLPAGEVETATNAIVQHKIARNDGTGLADYMLSTVDATCIIFDSAGRKYVATEGSGIYIISADNNTELHNYTVSNSQIMSDNVYCLALDEHTGTLYCSTDYGLCSVTTNGITVPKSLSKDNIRVYPNPVRPEYTGMITFEGLTVGADIKITTATGAIVHTGRSTSAMYQWDGCDQSGNRCASGVYNILLATEDGSEGCVAKVAMVR